MKLAVVVPFLNEAEHLPELLASIEAQQRPPDQLVLVDDGSDDGSAEIAEQFAARVAFAQARRRPRQRRTSDRLAQASELVAFGWGVGHLDDDWDVVAKLDADLRLPPCAFAALLDELEREPRLGIVGTFLQEQGEAGGLRRIQIGPTHVHGATKFYRRACFEQISPIPPILGWDTIDESAAQMHGWSTRSVALPGGDPLHLRPRGAYDGRLRAQRRFGECAWAFGEPLPLAVLQGIRQVGDPPRVAGGANYVAGWIAAAVRRRPRADPDVRRYVRKDQWGRVRRRALDRR